MKLCADRRAKFVLWLLAFATVTGTLSTNAGAVDWQGSASNDNWSTPGNWVGGVIPVGSGLTPPTTAVVTFGAAGVSHATPVVDAAWTVNQMDFSGATPYTLTGSDVTFDGTAPQLNISGAAHAITNNLTLASTLRLNNSVDFSIGSTYGGAGGLTKVGNGRLTLSNTNTHTGLTTVNGGTLQVGNGTTGPNLFSRAIVDNATIEFAGSTGGFVSLMDGISGTGDVVVSSGLVVSLTTPLTHAGSTTLTGTGTLNGSIQNSGALSVGPGATFNSHVSAVGSLTGSGPINIITSLAVGSDNTSTTFSGQFSNAGSLAKVGNGRLTLSNTNTHTGQTTVSGGTLQVGNGTTGPNLFPVAIVDNATIEFAGSTGGFVTLIDGISGTGDVVVSSGLVVSLTTPLTHAGSTTLTGTGTLNGSIQNSGALSVGPGATFNSHVSTVGSLTGSGPINIITSLAVGSDNTSTTYSGALGGGGSLTKVGNGRFTLAGTNTFAGGATVNGGTLIVTSSIPGPAIVNSGGTLGGTGAITGNVTINAGGTLAPGLSPGQINTGNLNLAGVASIEIQGTTLGSQYDNINVTGTVTIAGATLALSGAYVPAVGNTFTIISNDGVDPVVGTFVGLPEGATLTLNGVTLRISYVGGTGNDVVLSTPAPVVVATAVPTLSEWGVIVLSSLMAMFGLWQVRRRRIALAD